MTLVPSTQLHRSITGVSGAIPSIPLNANWTPKPPLCRHDELLSLMKEFQNITDFPTASTADELTEWLKAALPFTDMESGVFSDCNKHLHTRLIERNQVLNYMTPV
jgi:hypothetical protein